MQAENAFRLDGKVALVTGAGRGIGATCAEVLAKAGAKVMVTDILDAEGRAVAEKIKKSGGQAAFCHLDVTQAKQWQEVVEETIKTLGGLHILVNNAGIEVFTLIENLEFETWRRIHGVNTDGVFLGIKHAIDAMKPGGAAGKGGSIINMSSGAAMVGFMGGAAYNSSKGAVRTLTKVAAVECGKLNYNIRVNSIHPGTIRTDMLDSIYGQLEKMGFGERSEMDSMFLSTQAIDRLGDVMDVAWAVLYLASDASSFMTGSELVVDGGFLAQ